jgi:ABC-2 type transport system permease protein
MGPLLLRPQLISWKNRWLRKGFPPGRDVALFLFSLVLIVSVYQTTALFLQEVQKTFSLSTVETQFRAICTITPLLFIALFFSSLIASLSIFFGSKDLDLIIASPIPWRSFFLGKYAQIVLGSIWLIAVFLLPFIFGVWKNSPAGKEVILPALFILLVFITIPISLSILVVIPLSACISPHRVRHILLSACLLFGLVIVLFSDTLKGSLPSFQQTHGHFLPGVWSTEVLIALFHNSTHFPHRSLAFLAITALGLVLSASLITRNRYHSVLSRSRSLRVSSNTSYFLPASVARCLLPGSAGDFRAIMGKEFKLFSRDISQASQFILLLGLCFMYLVHLPKLSNDGTEYHDLIQLITNLALGSFVLAGVCNRFVFPSVSLEGDSFWILQSSPMSFTRILLAKFLCWFFPIGTGTTIILLSGCFAVDAPQSYLYVTILYGLSVSAALIALALGFGSVFVNFQWEHLNQLTASLGSLFFMLTSGALVIINIFLLALSFLPYEAAGTLRFQPINFVGVLGVVTLNTLIARWGIRIGERALGR